MKMEVSLKFGVALLGLICGASMSAVADEIASSAQQAPIPLVNPLSWTGFYVGSYVGGVFDSVTWRDNGYENVFYNSGGANAHAQGGIAAGGLAGFNYQIQRFVVGAESEFGYSGAAYAEDFSGYNINSNGGKGQYSLKQTFGDTDVLRLRARFAYAPEPQILFFVATGWTLAKTDSTLGGYCCGSTGGHAGGDPIRNLPSTYFDVHENKSLGGWNIGVGGEYAFASHFTTRLDYIYDGFSNNVYRYDYQPRFHDGREVGLNMNTVRAAVGYKF